jgi:hypothetical protein
MIGSHSTILGDISLLFYPVDRCIIRTTNHNYIIILLLFYACNHGISAKYECVGPVGE